MEMVRKRKCHTKREANLTKRSFLQGLGGHRRIMKLGESRS